MHAITWMNLKTIILSEKSKYRKLHTVYDPSLWNSRMGKTKADQWLGKQWDGEDWLQGNTKTFLEGWKYSTSWLWWWLHNHYKFVRTNQIQHLNRKILMYPNYTSILLIKNPKTTYPTFHLHGIQLSPLVLPYKMVMGNTKFELYRKLKMMLCDLFSEEETDVWKVTVATWILTLGQHPFFLLT